MFINTKVICFPNSPTEHVGRIVGVITWDAAVRYIDEFHLNILELSHKIFNDDYSTIFIVKLDTPRICLSPKQYEQLKNVINIPYEELPMLDYNLVPKDKIREFENLPSVN